jgi:hypothetical protein
MRAEKTNKTSSSLAIMENNEESTLDSWVSNHQFKIIIIIIIII